MVTNYWSDMSKKIYLLLSYSGSVPSKAIHYYTKDPYAHASISLNKELTRMYSFARLKPNNPIIAGFVQEDLKNGTFKKFKSATCQLYEITVSEKQYQSLEQEIEGFIIGQKKYGYNFAGVMTALVNKPLERENKYFCSQFVATVLQRSGINILAKAPGLTKPMDFAHQPGLSLIYEGALHDYPKLLAAGLV